MSASRGHHIAPSPNWYCPHISDSNTEGLLAYGARNELVFLRVDEKPPIYELIQNVHTERVTSVAFSKVLDNIIATGSDDCHARTWKFSTSAEDKVITLTQHKEHKFEHKVNCIAWQYESQILFVTTEGQSNVWAWDVQQATQKVLKHGLRNQPIVISSCPHNTNYLAVGFKSGILTILDVSKHGNIVLKLKGHEDDIISMSWGPKPPNKVDDSLDLASTSRDKTLRVWNLEKERYVHTFKIPVQQNQNKGMSDMNNKNRLWVTCLWVPDKDNLVLCSTITGDVIQVDFSPEKKPVWVTLDTKEVGGHNRCIFHLSQSDNVLSSVSLDRQIVLYDLTTLKSTFTLSTLGGFAQCLAYSPIDAGRLAIGCGDKTIRIWKTTCSTTPYSVSMVWQGINGKVTALAWHPTKENQLAFGTDEGHVGILDPSSPKPPIICRTFHRKIVYTITWAPCKNLGNDKSFLYTCGDGSVMIHDPSQHDKEAKNLNDFLNPKEVSKKSEIVWKQNYKALAVGCEDGTILVYSDEFKLLAFLKGQKHLIQCLKWHPISTSLNPNSLYQHWLASSSYDTVIHVYDLTDVMSSDQTEVKTFSQSSHQLVGHTNRVNSLSWNPHIDGRLASASYDGSVQTWNVLNNEAIGNYRGHRTLVLCVQWSCTDPDIIFSGGDDLSVQQFSVSSLKHVLPPPKKTKKSKKGAPKADATESAVENGLPECSSNTKLCNAVVKEKVEPPKAEPTTSAASKKKKKKQPATQKSGFPICNSLDCRGKDGTLEDIRDICKEMNRITHPDNKSSTSDLPDLKNSPNLGFFLKGSEFRKTQEAEENGHRENGNSDLLFQISLWRGDIEGVLKEAARQGQLNDYLLSLAPLASRSLWLDMCHKYALQLEKEENYAKSANYYLACHKIYEAVDMLICQHCYREALAVAKGRFPSSDPIFGKIYTSWAHKAERDGNFELVTKCYLAMADFSKAAKCLIKRNDGQSHATAAYIAALSGVNPDTDDCIISCIHQALTRNEWDVAKEMITEQTDLKVSSNLKPLSLVVKVHECLTSALKVAQDQKSATPLDEILRSASNNVLLWRGELLKEGKSFLDLLRDQNSEEDDAEMEDDPFTMLNRLSGQRSLSSKEIIYETAVGLTKVLLTTDDAESSKLLSRVLELNYSAEPEYTILNQICRLLFPFDLLIPLKSKSSGQKSSVKFRRDLEDLVREAYFKLEHKPRHCDVNSSLLGFFSANLLDCLAQEASKLSKGSYLKHQGSCENCDSVTEALTLVFEKVGGLLKQDDFHKYDTINVKLRKLDESIAKLSATPKSGGDNSASLSKMKAQKEDLKKELEHLPDEARNLPYPKSAFILAKGKELCKHTAESIHCSKSSEKVRSMTVKF